MATTLIDSLAIALGLDTRGLDKAAPAAEKKVNALEKAGDAATRSFSTLAKGVTEFLALLGGSYALKAFIEDTIKETAELERLSKNINVSIETISAWGNAVEESGGSASGLQGTLSMLSKAQTELMLTGQSSLIPYFSALSVSMADANGNARDTTDILRDLSERFSHMPRQRAFNMGTMMGLDQGTMNLLLQGPKAVDALVARQKEFNAVSARQGEQAVKLQKQIVDLKLSFAALGRNLLDVAAPAIEKVLNVFQGIADWVSENREFTLDFLKLLAVGIGGVVIAALPITGTVALIGALTAAIALLWQDYQTWKRGGDSLIDWAKWEPGIQAAIKGLKELRDIAGETFGTLRSVSNILGNKLKGNDAVAAQEDAKLQNRVRGWFGKSPVAVPSDTQAAKLNKPETLDHGQIQKYFEMRGWTPAQAAGIAANIVSESGGRSNATGDGGHAYGLGQWHGDRQKNFEKWAGHSMKLSTAIEQLGFYQHELTQGTEKGAGDKLKATKSPGDAGAVVSRYFERPADADGEANNRGMLAAMYAGVPGAAAALAASRTGRQAGNGSVDNSTRTQIDKIEVVTNATNADGIARDMGQAVEYHTTAQANSGAVL